MQTIDLGNLRMLSSVDLRYHNLCEGMKEHIKSQNQRDLS